MKIPFSFIFLIIVQTFAFSQANLVKNLNPIDADRVRRNEVERRKQQQDLMKEEARKLNAGRAPNTRATITSRIKSKRSNEQLNKLKPSQQELETYESLLKTKKGGIFRIFPDYDCGNSNILIIDGKCGESIPFSWSYSFLKKDYGDWNNFDFRYKDGNFVADGFLTQNIFTAIGNVPLENINLETKGLKFLLEFLPETEEEKMQQQFLKLASRISADDFNYSKAVIPLENMTYLMRVIAYRINYVDVSWIDQNGAKSEKEKQLLAMAFDNSRRDKIIAFRVVNKNADNSLTILWIELNSKKAPSVKFKVAESL